MGSKRLWYSTAHKTPCFLAAAASDVDEVWIAGPRELFITYASQYLPAWAKGKLKQNAASMMKATLVSMDEKKGQ